ncbi:MAG: DNA polymerase III subunit delta' [Actinomycetota bacterium]|nr:DNA polymerase III subunit delta' [Actinomycetota bacterium]
MTVWDDLVGQPGAVASLRAAAASAARVVAGEPGGQGMTHAWLFTGPPGSGRSVAARAFAAALQCPEQGCGHCVACHTALAGTSADVEVVAPEGLSIAVVEIRDLVLRAALAPHGSRWQVVVIEDADRLGERAANALLKAIEEPPQRGVFLLCVPSPEDVPATIRSRCRQVALVTPSVAAVAEVLGRRDGVDPAMAAFAARAAQSHVGRARRLARDEEARRERRAVLDLPRTATSVGGAFAAAADLVAAAKEVSQRSSAALDEAETASLREALGATGKAAPRGTAGAFGALEQRQKSRVTRTRRDALDRALVDLAAYYRDVLAVQLGAADRVGLVNVDLAEPIGILARTSAPEATLRRVESVLACREALVANVAPLLAVESMALALASG